MSRAQLRLPLSGISLDLIYNSIVSYVSGIQPADNADLQRVVELRKALSAKRKVVSSLENKIRAERQFSEQMIINADLKIERKDLEMLEKELKELL